MDSYRNWQDLLDDEPEEPNALPEGQVLTEAEATSEESVGAPKVSKDAIPLPRELLELQAERDRLERHLKALTGQGEPDPDAARQAAMYPMPVFTAESRIEERRGRRADETQRVTKQRRQERILLEKASFERTLELIKENIAERRRKTLLEERKREIEAFEEATRKRHQLARKVETRARLRLRLERQQREAAVARWMNDRRAALACTQTKSREQQQDAQRVNDARVAARRREKEAEIPEQRREAEVLKWPEARSRPKEVFPRPRPERENEPAERPRLLQSPPTRKDDNDEVRTRARPEPDQAERSIVAARKEPERKASVRREEPEREFVPRKTEEKADFSERQRAIEKEREPVRAERPKAIEKEREPARAEQPKAIEKEREPARIERPRASPDESRIRPLSDEAKRPESAHAKAKAEEERERQRREKLMLRRKSEREEEERLNRRHSSRQRDDHG